MQNNNTYQGGRQELNTQDTEHISFIGVISAILVAVLPMSTVKVGGRGLLLYLGVILLAAYVAILVKRGGILIVDRVTKSLIVMVMYALAACVLNRTITTEFIIEYVKNILIVFILVNSQFSRRDRYLLEGGAIIASLITCYSIINAPLVSFLDDRATVVIFGVAQDPNHICFLFVVPLFILMDFITESRIKVLKILSIITIIVIFYSVLLTGSRGGLLTCLIVVFLFVAIKYNGSAKLIFVGLFLLLAFYILSPYLLNLLPDSVARRFSVEKVMMDNGSGRTEIWKNAFNVFWSNPILMIIGHGTGSSNALIGSATHNTAIQLLLENGIIGLCLWLNFLWQIAKRHISYGNIYKISALIGIVLMSLDVSSNTQEYYWVGLALCLII